MSNIEELKAMGIIDVNYCKKCKIELTDKNIGKNGKYCKDCYNLYYSNNYKGNKTVEQIESN